MTRMRGPALWAAALALLLCGCGGGSAHDPADVLTEAVACALELVPEPSPGTIGGEWLILGASRSGSTLPEAVEAAYLDGLTAAVSAAEEGLGRPTEYARTVLALTALGEAPAVAGADLLAPLLDTGFVLEQGVNAAVYALLALDGGGYPDPDGQRAAYVAAILEDALPGGGWKMMGAAADPDMTAMAILALGPYRGQAAVEAAVQSGVSFLEGAQLDTGGYHSVTGETADTVATVLLALCESGIGPEDPRFVREGRTLCDLLLDYYLGDGAFAHKRGDTAINLMTTEQAILALASYTRYEAGLPGVFCLTEE